MNLYVFYDSYFFDLLTEEIGVVSKLGSVKEHFKLYYKIFVRHILVSQTLFQALELGVNQLDKAPALWSGILERKRQTINREGTNKQFNG